MLRVDSNRDSLQEEEVLFFFLIKLEEILREAVISGEIMSK